MFERAKKRLKKQKAILLFLLIVTLSIGITTVSILLFQQKMKAQNNARSNRPAGTRSVLDTTHTETLDIAISERKIEPNRAVLLREKDYKLRILKMPGVTCDSLRNEDINISIELKKNATEFPLSIRTKGTYVFSCSNQNAEITFVVE